MELRHYQHSAKEAVKREWDEGKRKTLTVLPTGTGKTIVFSKLSEELVRDGERVLILAHRGELLEQAADKLQQATGLGCATEKAEQSCLGSPYRVVVGSVQTMMQEARLAKFDPAYFDTIIVDEAHHALSDSYQRVLGHFERAKVLGVTATPDRGDMKNLGQYFDSLAYEYTLPTAIKEGYLAPIKAQTIPLSIDLSGVKQQSGDFATGDLGHALEPYLDQIAMEMARTVKGRRILVFLPLIKTSMQFRDKLQAHGFRAAEVNGQSDDRRQVLRDFEQGHYDVLCNSMLLTEGYDSPAIDCVVVLRPTKIRSLYSQCVGRGTRLHPGKTDLLLLDFLWHTDRHELCRPAHLIAKSDEMAKRMTEKIQDEPMDLEDAMDMAEKDAAQEREEALAKELAAMRKRKRKLVDPMQYEMSIEAEDLTTYSPAFGWEEDPVTKQQLETLEKFGIYPDSVESKGKASALIDRLMTRRQAGLATPKQIRCLERYGFNHVGTWQFDAAGKMIARISMNRWSLPPGINPSEYTP